MTGAKNSNPGGQSVFQSLFLWISLYDSSLITADGGDYRGFNPCSYGFPCMTGMPWIDTKNHLLFQSLFLWISLYDSCSPCHCVPWIRSFNPCSYGFPCMTRESEKAKYADWLFQSLFLWISLYDQGRHIINCPLFRKFQSLFLWISLYDTTMQVQLRQALRVSILVLMDFPVWQARQGVRSRPSLCFNPCSYGFPCMTAQQASDRHTQWGVSILVLMDFPVWLQTDRASSWGVRVSILVLMDFPVWQYSRAVPRPTVRCFNPCSYGFPCMTLFNALLDLGHDGVSILVLMDFPVWPLSGARFHWGILCFNPCSYGFPCMTLVVV